MNSIQPFAQAVAAAETNLDERTLEADAAKAGTDALRERMAAVSARREAVRADLAADKIDARSAGGLIALADDDMRDLTTLISEAEQRQAIAETARDAAHAQLDQARSALAKAEAGEKFNRLTDRAAELDRVLMDTVAAMAAMGRAAGKGNDLASLWRPSERMRQAILLRAVPRMEQAA